LLCDYLLFHWIYRPRAAPPVSVRIKLQRSRGSITAAPRCGSPIPCLVQQDTFARARCRNCLGRFCRQLFFFALCFPLHTLLKEAPNLPLLLRPLSFTMSSSETLPLYNPTATDPDGTNMAPNTSKFRRKRCALIASALCS
jgi:hypothetical protein